MDSAQSVYFLLGLVDDPYSFGDPCPPTHVRVSKYDEVRTTKGEDTFAKSLMGVSLSDSDKSNFLVSPAHVKIEDGKLLRHLHHVFGHTECSSEIIDEANGSGTEFMRLLRERAANASPEDKALVSATFAEIVHRGVAGLPEIFRRAWRCHYVKCALHHRTRASPTRARRLCYLPETPFHVFRTPSTPSNRSWHARRTGTSRALLTRQCSPRSQGPPSLYFMAAGDQWVYPHLRFKLHTVSL